MHQYYTHIQLAYFGFIPFLLSVAWQLMAGANHSAIQAFLFYSVAVMAFLAGNLWRAGEQSERAARLSVLAVLPVPALVFVAVEWQIAYLAFCYWLVLGIEKTTPAWQNYHPEYKKMRLLLTSVIFVCHLFQIAMVFALKTP
ncbi:DUF3429 family protein [Pseudoalteromonas fenneropenaei]|uniref:DUF3429 family protein n=1 Tax=Pseudoalteromonas fenneropenaei TaxID=1737459 RepID=A0ABV7CQA7_9GAMM